MAMRKAWAALLILCVAATCDRKAEEKVAVREVIYMTATSTAAVEVEKDTRTERGAVEVITTVEEFYPCDALRCPEVPDGGVASAVPKRRVTRTTRRDPVVEVAHAEAKGAAQAQTETRAARKAEGEARVETERVAGPPGWTWALVPVVVLAVLAGGMYLKQRFNLWG